MAPESKFINYTTICLSSGLIPPKQSFVKSFTDSYNVKKLVYFEQCDDILSAIEREKQLKNWRREWKVSLIEKDNPYWLDQWDEIVES